MFGYDSLANYFNCNFGLIQHHKWSVSEIENMLPWERQTYLSMLMKWLKDEKDRLQQQQLEQKAQVKRISRKRR